MSSASWLFSFLSLSLKKKSMPVFCLPLGSLSLVLSAIAHTAPLSIMDYISFLERETYRLLQVGIMNPGYF